MSNLVILKWPFEYKAKVETKSEIRIFDIFFNRMYKECFENIQINNI